ncbi:MAG TPA: hypothetical protein DF383_11015 [Deltaproteobacteria bacterium]|nr:hypothetical protein [Deltaproteobacteria bacterium]
MKPLASNATVWMAAPAKVAGKSHARVTTVNQEILRYITFFFGGACLFLFLLALGFAWHGDTSRRSAAIIGIFVAINLGLFVFALRSRRPFRALVIQTLLGGVLCPLAYLSTDGLLARWWPGYAILGFSGAVAWGLHTSNINWGRLVLLYYLANLSLTAWLAPVKPPFYEFGLRMGLIALTGLMLIQLTDILSMSLSKVYERSLQHRKAKEELVELSRLKTDFFANVSHEFRTPITLTLGPLEAALRGRYGSVGPELQGQLNAVIRNQHRLLGLINQILDVSKVEAGAARLKAARLPDFNRFVQERLEAFRPMVEERKLELRQSFDSLIPGMEIYIDREKFDKILLNLLSNALKFTPRGFIEVVTEAQENHILLKIRDSGIGIREAELPHVFERFHQAEGSAASGFAGTGLGLTLVKEFARLHGGEVTVKSRYGEGTAFQVALPVGKAHLSPASIVDFVEEESAEDESSLAPSPLEAESASPCAELNAEAERRYDPDQATLVCTEDNPELRYFLRDMLSDGYNVFVGADGREGLELAKQRHPDLILSDLSMPVMDGLEFCRKLREDPLLRAVPFVLLTARSMTASKLEGLAEGADDYLTKPFSETELLARVKNLVSLRRQSVQLERELEAARAIQFALLPPAPRRFSEMEIDYLYHPSAELSGDFCDILPSGDWVYFYLADVTSHGTASAQVTYLLKEIFSQLLEKGREPPLTEFLQEAQRRYASHRLNYDVALQIARYHLGHKTLQVLRGNAPAPLRVTPGGATQSLRVPPSPALSATTRPQSPEAYYSVEFTLTAGDKVYFFTDGCYEFPRGESEFGLRRLHALLAAAPENETWKEKVFAAITQAKKGAFPDDLTFLRLKLV